MARRREFENVADGMTDHMIGPFDDTLVYAKELIQTRNLEAISLDLLTGRGSLPELLGYGDEWRWIFYRHLAVRHMPLVWVAAAEVRVSIAELGQKEALMLCSVRILDDLGKQHASTRRAAIHLLARDDEASVSALRKPTMRAD